MNKTLLIAALVAALGLNGCGSNSSLGASASDNPAKLDKVSVVLDWTPNTNHTGIYVAQDKGFYQEAGLEVDVLGFSQAGPESVMAHGGAEFGFSGTDSLAAAKASGIDLQMVYNLQYNSSWGIAVRADSDMHRARDLEGRTLAAYGGGVSHNALVAMMVADGGQGSFDEVVVGTGSFEAVIQGRADFAEGLASWEAPAFAQQGTPLRFLFPADYGVPSTPAMLGLSVSTDLMDENPDLVKRFVAATSRGYDYTMRNPEEAGRILIDTNPQAKLDAELVQLSQAELVNQYWPDPQGRLGYADMDAWQVYLDYLVDNKLLTDADGDVLTDRLAAQDLVTNEFLP